MGSKGGRRRHSRPKKEKDPFETSEEHQPHKATKTAKNARKAHKSTSKPKGSTKKSGGWFSSLFGTKKKTPSNSAGKHRPKKEPQPQTATTSPETSPNTVSVELPPVKPVKKTRGKRRRGRHSRPSEAGNPQALPPPKVQTRAPVGWTTQVAMPPPARSHPAKALSNESFSKEKMSKSKEKAGKVEKSKEKVAKSLPKSVEELPPTARQETPKKRRRKERSEEDTAEFAPPCAPRIHESVRANFLSCAPSSTLVRSEAEPLSKNLATGNEEVAQNQDYDCTSEDVHVAKIRTFIRSAITKEIEKANDVFANIRSRIPNGATRDAFAANLSKCRFRDVVCLDSSRVILESGGFIHASRIPYGNSQGDGMIVTQMPLPHTIVDFWEMVWQEKANAILLIATMTEWNAIGSTVGLYPIETDSMDLSNGTSVTWISTTEVKHNWKLVTLRVRKGKERRTVEVIHFEGWSHGKAPGVETVWEIQSYLRRKAKPLVIVSMSGVGRAGSYAVLEYAHNVIHDAERPTFQMSDCIEHVRSHRFHALQSPLQITFVYVALLSHLFVVKRIANDVPERLFEKYLSLCTQFVDRNSLTTRREKANSAMDVLVL